MTKNVIISSFEEFTLLLKKIERLPEPEAFIQGCIGGMIDIFIPALKRGFQGTIEGRTWKEWVEYWESIIKKW